MEQRIIQHQTQKLVLSPQIRQYFRLLQLPIAELSQAIENELAENPLLEEDSREIQDESLALPEQGPEPPTRDKVTLELDAGAESFDKLARIDEQFWNSYNDLDSAKPDLTEFKKRKDYEESLITRPEALSDFLLWQMGFLNLNEAERRIAEEIIGNINEEGYLKASLEEIAKACQADPAAVQEGLSQIQQLDPPGIGARDLREALLIQLKRKGTEASLAFEIVRHHLTLLEKRAWQDLAKILSVDIQQVKQAAELIIHLEPKPGRTFYSEEPIAVTPDATITLSNDENEKFKIEIHHESLPELRINPYYRRLLRDKHTDEKTKTFIREKMQAGINFLRALTLRKSTLREITEELLRVQFRFFEKGFSELIPLRLKDIANHLGIHESTVSRALQGKYISTPQGTIPYKSFFSTKLETLHGEAESQKSILERMRGLLAREDAGNPLSDQEIVKLLNQEGILIARRTVAKYRELLKILPSHLRRRE